jgi:hypothetical protein
MRTVQIFVFGTSGVIVISHDHPKKICGSSFAGKFGVDLRL